jgi:hypothetical protein
MTESLDTDVAEVIGLEQRLLHRDVRLDRSALSELLHENFREFGASGRSYDRAGVIETLLATDGSSANAFAFKAARLSVDVVLLTYRTDTPSLRTSIWTRGADGNWRLLHHQGTPAIA